MTTATLYTRTAKGEQEAATTSPELARYFRIVLNAVDGKSTVEALRGRFDYMSASELDDALAALAGEGYIRLAALASGVPSAPEGMGEAAAQADEHLRKAQELRAKIRARREGVERSATTVEVSAATRQEPVRREAGEAAAGQSAERARQEAAQQAAREAEARREATERARQEAAEQARRDAEEKARREAAERARREAEEQARRSAEDAADAESARQRADNQARLMAEEQAWQEAEEQRKRDEAAEADRRAVADAAQAARSASAKPVKWGKPLALGLVGLVVLGLVVIHLIPFDGQIPAFEKAATAQFQQPVKIGKLHLALLPSMHLRFDGVSVGAAGQISIPRIKASGEMGNLFNEKKTFTSLELESPVLTEEGLGWILFGRSAAGDIAFGDITALNATLASKNVSLPAFDARLPSDGAGGWKAISIVSVDQNLSVELQPDADSIQVAIAAKALRVPFGSTLTLDEFAAKGTANAAGIVLSEFKGFVYGGTLGGTARLKWGSNWSLAGELNAKQIDTALLFPSLLTGGRLAGTAAYVMQGPEATRLFTAPHVEGNFTIPWGTLLQVDLGRLMQGGERRGETKFSEFGGSFVHDRGATEVRALRLSQGTMLVSGTAAVDLERAVRGRFAADLKLSREQRRANLTLSGTLDKMEWNRQ